MRLLGIDFTSAPSRVHPLWFAHATFDDAANLLTVNRLESHTSFAAFDSVLAHSPDQTILAIDAPFGLPLAFLDWAGLTGSWHSAIPAIAAMGDRGFESLITRFRTKQPDGAKHPLRSCDHLAGAASPINIVRPPVGKMFFQCATRLARSDWRIVPCRERDATRIAVEAYPALVARTLIGRASYKGGADAATRLDRQRSRELLLSRLLRQGNDKDDTRLADRYGLRVQLSSTSLRDQALSDEDANALDAILCCVQASWAWTQRTHGLGVAATADPREGWIIDPATTSPR
jgi:hypothetical protein